MFESSRDRHYMPMNCRCGEVRPERFYIRTERDGSQRYFSECKSCFNSRSTVKMRENKAWIVDVLGGGCIRCGYSACLHALDVHHADPEVKDDNFRRMSAWSRDRILKEISTCVLLCKNCHTELHAGIWVLGESEVVGPRIGLSS